MCIPFNEKSVISYVAHENEVEFLINDTPFAVLSNHSGLLNKGDFVRWFLSRMYKLPLHHDNHFTIYESETLINDYIDHTKGAHI